MRARVMSRKNPAMETERFSSQPETSARFAFGGLC
jgi:hypothetical protein